MHFTYPCLIVVLAFCVFSPMVFGQSEATEKTLFTEAQRAYAGGDLSGARQKFETVLELNPKNTQAANYVRTIKARQAQSGGEPNNAFDSVIIPKINFRDATFGSTLDYLKQQVEEVTKGQTTVNFVPQLTPEQLNRKVSLNLQNVPLPVAMKYLCDLAGAQFTIEKYAVVVKPLVVEKDTPASQ